MPQTTDIRSLMAHSLRENALPIGLATAHVLAAMTLANIFQFDLRIDAGYNFRFFGTFYLLFLSTALLWLLVKIRPPSPMLLLSELPTRWRLRERVITAAPVLVAVAVVLPVYSSVKAAIPAITHYDLDPQLAQLDLWIHGRHAWEVLQPMLGYPVVSYVLNILYHLWLPVFYVAFCAVAIWIEQPELRRRFLIAFLLCWLLLGNVAAILLPSVGPCFYSVFYSDDPYADLMNYLHSADQVLSLPVLDVQALLLAWWQQGEPGLGRGISAMPSLHVSIAFLIMLLGWKVGRFAGWAATLFLIAILLGSVHLGYHYAIDGYVSLLATAGIWWASKHLANLRLLPSPKLAENMA